MIYFVAVIVFVAWRAIVDKNKKKAEDKELVVRFLREKFPDSATAAEIADYTNLGFLKALEISRELVEDKRAQEDGFGFILTGSGNKRCPPKLRLVKCD